MKRGTEGEIERGTMVGEADSVTSGSLGSNQLLYLDRREGFRREGDWVHPSALSDGSVETRRLGGGGIWRKKGGWWMRNGG